MGSALSSRIFPNALMSRAASTFNGSYLLVGSAIANSVRIVKFTNNSDKDVTLSWDGLNDHDFIPAASYLLLDISSNRETSNQFEIASGTKFYVKANAGTGSFYISSYYGT